ncbi:MAG: ABC transporter permease [Proteobacteria bacterium]|nr:ABC transporter permease [Pseudomonadota bacterium]
MFANYLKVTLRALLKNKTNFAINVAGLSLGMVCSILIMLFVADEFAFDQFHEDSDRIYRLRVERYSGGGAPEFSSAASAPMLPAALNDATQIESGTRLFRNPVSVKYGDVSYFEEQAYFVDSVFFEVFSFEAISGDIFQALVNPDSLVMTESTAQRYFGSENPIGQLVEIAGRLMTVRAIVADVPSQSHFTFDLLASFSTLESMQGPSTGWNWWGLQHHTYLKLTSGSSLAAVEELLREMPSRYVGDEESGSGYRQFLYLQPLEDIHLTSNYRYELGSNSTRQTVFVFAAVALLVLLIACINFINLSTARSAERAKEVGLRKTLGAERSQLVSQFLGESVAISLLSLVVALIAIQLLLPSFNALSEKSLSLNYLQQWPLLFGLVAGAVLVGLLAGLYPALVLASFIPTDALKAQSSPGSTNAWLRQSLVVMQFAISVMLIIGSLIAQRQLNYMLSSDMGFDKEQTLVINANYADSLEEQLEPFRESLLTIPGIAMVTASQSIPGRPMPTNVADLRSGQADEGQTFFFLPVDHDFIDTYGLEMISGRGFSRDYETDAGSAFILNEAAYKALGWTDAQQPLGRELTRQFGDSRNIIGVMRDFNYRSLQFEVEPLVLYISTDSYAFVTVKLTTENLLATIAETERVWREFVPDMPFEYFFLSEDFAEQYHLEVQISRLLRVFTLLAIGIACMGLFALAAFMTEKRRKEVGVRKVLGASASQIVLLLSYSFSKPVIIAALIALPLSWILANQWLGEFANRITVTWDIFGISVALAFSVALATVAGQALKAARANPTKSIRLE